MVRALLHGRKTQTRRVFSLPTKGVYERPDMGGWEPTINGGGGSFTIGRDGTRIPAPETVGIWHRTTGRCLNAPYQVGDRLYVRERVACGACAPGKPSHWSASFWRREQGSSINPNGLWYEADGLSPEKPITERGRWVQGMHMPRWASRLTLTVTDVRVQRLQALREADAIAEGCPGILGPNPDFPDEWDPSPVEQYRELWDHLNADRGYAWAANPWVVAVSFTIEHRNIDTRG